MDSNPRDGGSPEEPPVRAIELWTHAAKDWAESAERLVATVAELARRSRDLGEHLSLAAPAGGRNVTVAELAQQLPLLAHELEQGSLSLGDRYLETAANLEQYAEILRMIDDAPP